jgi:ankyrin repeat protein
MFARYAAGVAALLALSLSPALAGQIHDAARAGNLALVTKLIDEGAPLDARDGTRETPLIAAALAGQTAVVLDLLARGADADARNDRGMTALHAAAFVGDGKAVEALIGAGIAVNDAENKFKVTPLIVAAEENHIGLVEDLIARGAGIEIIEAHGYTALTRSGFKARDEIVALLLREGAACQEIDQIWFKECSKRKSAMGL